MFKKISIIILILLLLPTLVFAQTNQNAAAPPNCGSTDPSGTQLFNPLAGIKVCGLIDFMSWLVGILSGFIGLFAVIAIVIAGYEMVTRGGDPEKLKEAKQRIFYAITGLIVTLLAYTIVKIILNLIANKV